MDDERFKSGFKALASIIITAYHNTAVEHEYLKDVKQTLAFYLKAFAFSNKFLGAENPMTKLCQSNFLDSKLKAERLQATQQD